MLVPTAVVVTGTGLGEVNYGLSCVVTVGFFDATAFRIRRMPFWFKSTNSRCKLVSINMSFQVGSREGR